MVTAELLLATHVFRVLVSDPGAPRVARLLAIAAIGSFRSLWALLHVDAGGTLESLGLITGKLLIATLPLLVLALRRGFWGRVQVVWLPLLVLLLPMVGGASPILVAGLSGLSLWLIRFRWLRWTAILPLLAVCAPVPIHQYAFVWNRSALIERCESNSGRRPINFEAQQANPGFMGVSRLRPDELLLPGPGGRGSWWLRRSGSDWKIEALSKVDYGFWPGCTIGDELWLARPNFMMGVRRDPVTGIESVRKISIPTLAMDFAEVVCLPEEGRVLITEALNGNAIWEVVAETGAVRRLPHDMGGLGVMARRGRQGQIIVANGSDLIVYSLEREEVIERTPAAVQMFGGLDVCAQDGEVAMCDVLGRIRFFKPDAQGHYHFDWGISVAAPRELVYSPDCRYAAIASFDDTSVYLIDRTARRQVATYRVGPALRGITFLGPREFAIADACTMSDIVF